jgi:hypothetical protein
MTHGDFIRQLRWLAIGVMQDRVSQAGTLAELVAVDALGSLGHHSHGYGFWCRFRDSVS